MHLAHGCEAAGSWLPFGDQGFVLPRVAFEDLAGFDPRLRRARITTCLARASR